VKKKIKFIQDAKFQSTELQQYFDAKRQSIKREEGVTIQAQKEIALLKLKQGY
jgi:hypothetical protein